MQISTKTKAMTDEFVIAAYNCEKKQLIGIFANQTVCARYLQAGGNKVSAALVHRSLVKKGKMTKHRFDFKITVRRATPEQVELLGTNRIQIVNGYPQPTAYQANSFTGTRYSLYNQHTKSK